MYTRHLPRGETQVQKVKEEMEEDPVADLAQLVAKANLPGNRALVPTPHPIPTPRTPHRERTIGAKMPPVVTVCDRDLIWKRNQIKTCWEWSLLHSIFLTTHDKRIVQ